MPYAHSLQIIMSFSKPRSKAARAAFCKLVTGGFIYLCERASDQVNAFLLELLTREDVTDTLSRNVGKQLSHDAV